MDSAFKNAYSRCPWINKKQIFPMLPDAKSKVPALQAAAATATVNSSKEGKGIARVLLK